VAVNGISVNKPGSQVDENADIKVSAPRINYVSRGGLKLEGAARYFQVSFEGKTVLDIGASTGGFTDYALQNGAKRVYAVDVGYGQLDWSLRNDPRVVVKERTNVRYLAPEDLGEPVDIVTMDVSFISTTLIFPVIKKLLKADGEVVSLIKPQFEAGKDKVGKKGVVKDAAVHAEVLLNCIAHAQDAGLNLRGVHFSPITGPQGNIEFFVYLSGQLDPMPDIPGLVREVVAQAHTVLEAKTR